MPLAVDFQDVFSGAQLASPSTCPGHQVTFPPETPSSLLPSSTSQLNNPLSLAPSGWALKLLVLFQAWRGGWDKGGASGERPGKCPGNFESALPVFLDSTVGSSPLPALNPEPTPQGTRPQGSPAWTQRFRPQPPLLDLGSRASALHPSLTHRNPVSFFPQRPPAPATSPSAFQN